MDLSQVTIEDQRVIVAPGLVRATKYHRGDGKEGLFISVGYKTEEERRQIKFKPPRKARLIFNEHWRAHAWWRPRDISKATAAAFELNGMYYTFVREYIG